MSDEQSIRLATWQVEQKGLMQVPEVWAGLR